MYEKLFEPIKIGSMELKNRLFVPAMSTLTATPEGASTEQFIAYHERKAQGGWGFIITEYFGVAPYVGFFPRMLGIWNDELIESHKELTRRVHAAGAKIGAQISHSGRETYIAVSDENLVAPSPYMDVAGEKKPRELTVAEIKEIVSQYGDTARNLKKAGFDAVEIYAAHGYLISNFLSKYSNKRTDEYGGCLENRMRFLLEIIKDTREKVGPDFPILVRLSTREFVPGGISMGETRVIVKKLEQAGVDAIDCSQGIFTVSYNIVEPMQVDNCAFVDASEEIKKVVNIPVLTAGRINEACLAETVLLTGKADMVGMGRASLADPDFPKKVQEGRIEDIRYCIGCVQACIGGNMRGENCHCLVNPELDREFELKPNPVAKRKKIFIAGGGVAGCEAAIVAAQRGHDVTLFEKSDKLGGTWLIAALPLYKSELLTFVGWQKHELAKLHVKIELNTELTKEMIAQHQPDEVIVATGCKPFIPNIPGHDMPHVVQANDVLQQNVRCGKNVVVLGGGSVGVETAEYIAWFGSNVTIVEMREDILIGCERETMLMLRQGIKENGIQVYTDSKVCEIGEGTVTLERKGKKIVLEEVDHVVVAAGSKPVNTLEAEVKELGIPVRVIGDSKQVRNGLHAILEGYMAGYEI
ncbi:FAD-dependent oxidoreductase [Agathobaculum sp. Marseille-P7918]|uniref:oxidoreductase n=1 Tax=Agathobaculum sp. Marseille-P7918 TaxID=2479843 RepID=UPI003561EDD4